MLLGTAAGAYGQQAGPWANWSWLMGTWQGVGSGEPGKGVGGFSLQTDLDQKVLVRRSHSEYPAQAGKPRTVHDDLMIVSPGASADAAKAVYFDNEGHTINYSVSYADRSIVLLSDRSPGTPVFRLTYTQLDKDSIDVKFEISMDGTKFTTYVQGKCVRRK
jgi:hypothetical protein